jgi:hypothetical protein
VKKENDILAVKSSFENSKNQAPLGLWDTISSELQASAIDKKVAESFSSLSTIQAPAFDFSQLSQTNDSLDQLIKQSFEQTRVGAPVGGWEKVEDGLDVENVWENLKDQVEVDSYWWSRVASAAAVLILFASIPFNTSDQSILEDSFSGVENIVTSFKNSSNQEPRVLIAEAPTSSILDLATVSYHQESDENQAYIIENDVVNHSDFIMSNDLATLPSAVVSKVAYRPAIPDIHIEKSTVKDNWRLSAGIIGGVNNSWIFDNDTRASFDNESLLESKVSFAEMYGLTAEALLNDKHSFSTNILINSAVKSKLGYYENGMYKTRNAHIDFFKMSLLYGRKIQLSKQSDRFNLHVKTGPYFAFNKRSRIVNEDVLTAFNSTYKKLDVGVNLQIGQEHTISNFIIQYGFNAELGLRNIYKGNGYLPSKLNYTNQFNAGLYLSLKYRLN